MEELVSALSDVSADPGGKDLSADWVRLLSHHYTPHDQTAQAWSPVYHRKPYYSKSQNLRYTKPEFTTPRTPRTPAYYATTPCNHTTLRTTLNHFIPYHTIA